MDGYLSKPIRIEELKEAITHIENAAEASESYSYGSPSFGAIGRVESLLDGVMGDRALLAEMAELWLIDSEKQMSQIAIGFEHGDGPMIQRAAHALRGSVGTFQATPAYEAAKELEIFAKNGNLDGARQVFATLSAHIELVRQELRKLSKVLR
jgi:HPt (histidine-containing phosphotransfer) domain-containing protein